MQTGILVGHLYNGENALDFKYSCTCDHSRKEITKYKEVLPGKKWRCMKCCYYVNAPPHHYYPTCIFVPDNLN